ncbi:MAG: VanW family protein [Clostridiaceae bacterium]|nr:VanW family protein [Clostridiaceae bacterium]
MKKENRFQVPTWILGAALLCALVFGIYALYVSVTVYTHEGVLDGVTLMGEPIAGLSRDEVLAVAENWVSERLSEKTLALHVGGTIFTVRPEDAAYSCDIGNAVGEAVSYGREGSLFARFIQQMRAKNGGYDVKLRFSYDAAHLAEVAGNVAATMEIPYVPSSYWMTDDTVTIDVGHMGRRVDADALADALTARFDCADFAPLWFPVTTLNPVPLDLATIEQRADISPVNASFDETDPQRATIFDESPGRDFDREAAEKKIESGEGTGEYGSVFTFARTVVEPEVTRASLTAMLYRDVLANRSTKLNTANIGRTANVRIACERVNGTILGVGETFSYNNTVGERTYAQGFQDATIFLEGEKVEDVGGGICQVSSTLYMAATRADLEIVERANHRFAVSYTPLGEDATVYYGGVDFRFRNDTNFPIRVECTLKGSTVTVRLIGTDEYPERSTELVTQILSVTEPEDVETVNAMLGEAYCERTTAGQRGYTTITYRVTYENGIEIARTVENRSYYQKEDREWTVGRIGNSTMPPETVLVTEDTPEDTEKPSWLG